MNETIARTLRQELREFIVKACGADDQNVTTICNALRRGYYTGGWTLFRIESIDELNQASMDDIKKIRCLGSKRLAIVEEAKRLIKEFLEGDA